MPEHCLKAVLHDLGYREQVFSMEFLLEDTKLAFEHEITPSWVSTDELEFLIRMARAHSVSGHVGFERLLFGEWLGEFCIHLCI